MKWKFKLRCFFTIYSICHPNAKKSGFTQIRIRNTDLKRVKYWLVTILLLLLFCFCNNYSNPFAKVSVSAYILKLSEVDIKKCRYHHRNYSNHSPSEQLYSNHFTIRTIVIILQYLWAPTFSEYRRWTEKIEISLSACISGTFLPGVDFYLPWDMLAPEMRGRDIPSSMYLRYFFSWHTFYLHMWHAST
jgi:hypothetical protein